MKNWPWHYFIVIGVILLALFYFVFYKSKDTEIQRIKTERIKVEQDVRRSQENKKKLDEIITRIEERKQTLKDLEEYIPQKKDISNILRRIQQFAYDHQLNITKFIPQGEIKKELISEWPILIEMTGTYHRLGMFFDRLSRFQMIFTVDKFSMQSLARQSPAATINVNCTAKTYIFAEKPQIQPEDQDQFNRPPATNRPQKAPVDKPR